MRVLRARFFIGRDQFLARVLANGFEQVIARGLGLVALGDDQGFVGELGEKIECGSVGVREKLPRYASHTPTQHFSRVERPAADEDREQPE